MSEASDILVVGGGTSGAALAGLLAEQTDASVLLLEAGPDYGPFEGGRWPVELLDARHIGLSHDWGYQGLAHPTHEALTAFNRARVIGGCSAHNGCVALAGHRRDYDHWAELGNAGWEYEAVAPAFARARRRLRVRIPGDDEVTPYQAAFVAGAVAAGIPRVANLDEPDDDRGVGVSPANIAEGVRWNTAFAYLDPARARPNLTVRGGALVDRVLVEGGRAVAVEASVDGRRQVLRAGRIVLAAGA
ncbi:MAG TPA: GMC family oxidoreductase N-terminal domain-containing protein, partial [Thermomicrobiaceae bacterium]|nr:GMC family oxidoreductase N-terminal domain-containing protein [Thermomicrobiaceae bacterium]